jgi:hypothetical protein
MKMRKWIDLLGSQLDWAAFLAMGIEIAKATSDALAAAKRLNELASIELDLYTAHQSE